jgi:indole-3-glycerol phosphate synthase
MSNRLTPILDAKRREIAALAPRREALRRAALERNDFRGFARALDRRGIDEEAGTLRLVAEVKRASPSAGVIATGEFDPVAQAQRYEAGGAHAVSVLTDASFFGGHLEHLKAVRGAIELPVLRKDFMLDELQIFEAGAAGADAVLLIVAALDDASLAHLLEVAQACQLDALVEVHTLEELDRALEADVEILGINNRNLSTFEVDLAVTETLAEQVPAGVLLISESGIRSAEESRRVRAAGADAILVGEALMRSGPAEVGRLAAELMLRPAALASPGGN